MEALQKYNSSDSEDESESYPDVGASPGKSKHVQADSDLTMKRPSNSTPLVISTPDGSCRNKGLTKLPMPDFDLESGTGNILTESTKETASVCLLPWSRPHQRNKLCLSERNLENEHKVLGVQRLLDLDTKFEPLVQSQKHCHRDVVKTSCNNGAGTYQDERHRFHSGRMQVESNRVDSVIHPMQFGPQNSLVANNEIDVGMSSTEARLLSGHSPSSMESPFYSVKRLNKGHRQIRADSLNIRTTTQPYVPKRLRQTHSQDTQDANSSYSVSSGDKVKESMYITQPTILYQMDRQFTSKLPRCKTRELQAHTGPTTHVRWCAPQYSHLLLSTSMDKTVRIWNGIGRGNGRCLRTLSCHEGAVKDAQWAEQGRCVLSCGFDKMARLSDVESGNEFQVFEHPSYATCIKTKPDDPNVFITGTYNSSIYCWDVRTGNLEHEYRGKLGQILDIEFLPGCDEFASSCDAVSRDSADRTIMVWDLRTTAVVSNQLYHEKYTCPSLRLHPSDSVFMAQSNANYIAMFSTVRPYRLNKFKRFEGHQLEGYHISCDVSSDGALVVSGSSDGKAYIYDYHTTRIMKTLQCHTGPCTDVAWHPVLPGVLASCSWSGSVNVWQ